MPLEKTHAQSMRLQLAILGEPRLHKEAATCNDAVSTCQEIMAKLPKDLPSSPNLAIEGSRTAIHVSMQQLPISLRVTAQANLKGSYTYEDHTGVVWEIQDWCSMRDSEGLREDIRSLMQGCQRAVLIGDGPDGAGPRAPESRIVVLSQNLESAGFRPGRQGTRVEATASCFRLAAGLRHDKVQDSRRPATGLGPS